MVIVLDFADSSCLIWSDVMVTKPSSVRARARAEHSVVAGRAHRGLLQGGVDWRTDLAGLLVDDVHPEGAFLVQVLELDVLVLVLIEDVLH
jgi:hypothetical protein